MNSELAASVADLAGLTALVIGDLILDEYITGTATRMSREAPVPVLELSARQDIAGGAANPAANIVSLGGSAIQIGIIGCDAPGDRLLDALRECGINAAGVLRCDDRPTTVKTRVLAQMGLRFPQQITRIDTVARHAISPETESAILDSVSAVIDDVDAVLLSHYHGGLLTPSLVARIRELCRRRQVLLTADLQGDFERFAGLDVIKCNGDDAARYLQRELLTDAHFSQAAAQLRQELDIQRAAIITRGSDGATLATADSAAHCPTPRVADVYDTVGAGDTAIAVITLALAADMTPLRALILANHASGIVVRHLGNYAPSADELRQSIAGAT